MSVPPATTSAAAAPLRAGDAPLLTPDTAGRACGRDYALSAISLPLCILVYFSP